MQIQNLYKGRETTKQKFKYKIGQSAKLFTVNEVRKMTLLIKKQNYYICGNGKKNDT